jgi:DNA polymerase elongation subunit (family B)
VLQYREFLFDGKAVADELVLSQSIQKPLDEYKIEGIHVRIAKERLEAGHEVYQGMKIPYVVTGREGGKKSGKLQGVHVDDFDGEYDAHVYWRDKVYPPVMRVLEAAFPGHGWKALLNYDPNAEQRELLPWDGRTEDMDG